MQLRIKRLNPEAKLPTYAHPGDVGLDLFSLEDYVLQPGERHMFFVGFALEFPIGYAAIVKDKGGTSKNGLHTMGGVFDAGYRGEYNVNLINVGAEPYHVQKGDKIAQLVIFPVVIAELTEVSELSTTSVEREGLEVPAANNFYTTMISPLMPIPKKKPFIVIEGGEGSGKSSLLIALKDELGDTIVTTREPGGSPYAEVIRDVTLKNPLAKGTPAETTLCLMFAARFDNTARAVVPALDSGKPVISDRFDASSYTYQVWAQSGGALDGLFWNLRDRLAVKPDLYIFVDVEPKEGIRRARSRNQSLLQGQQYDHFDDREIEFHEKVREGYLQFFSKVPHIIIDANRPLEEVKKDFIAQIRKCIK